MAGYARGIDSLKIGSLTLVATVAFSVLFMVMTSRGISRNQWDVHVRIPTAEGLSKRDPVFFRGVGVGEVRTLQFAPDGDVVVRVRLTQRVPLTRAAYAELAPLDMFGRQSLVLRDQGTGAARLQDEDTIRAPLHVSMPGRLADLGERAGRVLNDTTVELLQAALAGTGAATLHVAALSARLDTLLAGQQLALHGLLEQTTAAARNVNAATDPAGMTELRLELTRVLHGVAQLTARLDSTSTEAAGVLRALNQGDGSAGRLLSDPELYRRASELLESADGLLRDVKVNPRKYLSVSVF